MLGQLVIFYLVNFCKILISKTTKELFCDPNSLLLFGKEKSPNCNTDFLTQFFSFWGNFHQFFFFTKMEPINFESIFGMMANDPEKAQHEAKPVTYALNTSK
jgi:hypothetical protein